MVSFRFVPDRTTIPFLRYEHLGYVVSALLILVSLVLLPTKGLNLGIDFRGGILIEVRMPDQAPDLGAMRATLGGLGLGEVALQEFGEPTDVLIRIERQTGDEAAQLAAVDVVKAALAEGFGEDISYRRVEFVGPKVSEELFWAGAQAVIYALIAILAYIWFRFEWQFGVGAVATLVLDVTKLIGFYALLGIPFNLVSIAAILTVMGFSVNDKVVVYDRVRENLRKYKSMPLRQLIDRSINETLNRTVNTSIAVFLSTLPLALFGGEAVADFAIVLLFGIVLATSSSIFIAAPILLFLGENRLRRDRPEADKVPAGQVEAR
jgi:preprotein translocase subunit SecF